MFGWDVREIHSMMFGIQGTLTAESKDKHLWITLTIGAGAGGAMVNLLLAVEPCVSCGALAKVSSVWVVSTAAAVGARPISTRHSTQLAVVAIETVGASAGICVLQILRVKNRTGLTSRSVLQLQLLQTAAF